ncbi:unnamed protein product [Schistosoma rodhaini]|nr:unnamed protein product [Schistosoma rodhaini]
MLTYFCAVTFGAESLHRCNEKLKATMEYCFQRNGRYSIPLTELKRLRDACMNDRNCKTKAKDCLLSKLKSSEFGNCPSKRTYVQSIDRMFK